jgi:hypothetical protein
MTENAQMGLKVWDVTVVDTLADSYVLKTSEVCKRKHSKYSSIISSNYVFKGLAFETLDPWCKEAIDFINVIGIRKGTFWGIRIRQKYLYEISILRLCSIGNDVTEYVGLSEPFYKDLIILKTKLTLNYYQQESRFNLSSI